MLNGNNNLQHALRITVDILSCLRYFFPFQLHGLIFLGSAWIFQTKHYIHPSCQLFDWYVTYFTVSDEPKLNCNSNLLRRNLFAVEQNVILIRTLPMTTGDNSTEILPFNLGQLRFKCQSEIKLQGWVPVAFGVTGELITSL